MANLDSVVARHKVPWLNLKKMCVIDLKINSVVMWSDAHKSQMFRLMQLSGLGEILQFVLFLCDLVFLNMCQL